MTAAKLHGTLRRLPDALVGGARAMGIAFEAKGPLHGALPDRPAMALAGTITMKGTAYYDYATALLVALDATLAIDGNLDDSAHRAPVSIVYARSIRSAPPARSRRASSPPPAAPSAARAHGAAEGEQPKEGNSRNRRSSGSG